MGSRIRVGMDGFSWLSFFVGVVSVPLFLGLVVLAWFLFERVDDRGRKCWCGWGFAGLAENYELLGRHDVVSRRRAPVRVWVWLSQGWHDFIIFRGAEHQKRYREFLAEEEVWERQRAEARQEIEDSKKRWEGN